MRGGKLRRDRKEDEGEKGYSAEPDLSIWRKF